MTMSRLFLHALSERSYPLCAVGYKRTREHLLSWSLVLPRVVKEVVVSLSKVGEEAPKSPHSGSWLFLYENIPQLRYHNPAVKFSFEAHHDAESQVYLTLDDGKVLPLVTTGLRQREIQDTVENLIESIMENSLKKVY